MMSHVERGKAPGGLDACGTYVLVVQEIMHLFLISSASESLTAIQLLA